MLIIAFNIISLKIKSMNGFHSMGFSIDKVISLNIHDTPLLSVFQFDIPIRSSANGEEWLQPTKLIFNQFNSIIFVGMCLL